MRNLLIAALILLTPAALHAETKIGFRQVTSTHPVAVQRGTASVVELRSNFTLDETHAVFFDRPGITMTLAEEKPIEAPRRNRGSVGTPFKFEVVVPEGQQTGVYECRIATTQAVSSAAELLVTEHPVLVEDPKADNGRREVAQPVSLPAAVCGACEAFEDVDCYRFSGTAGQELTFNLWAQRVTERLHNMVVRGPRIYLMDAILTLYGPGGQVVAQNDNFVGGDAFLHHVLRENGEYVLEVRDARYAGNARYTYCVEIAERPFAHAVFPLAVQRGQEVEVQVIGHILGDAATAKVTTSETDALGWTKWSLEVPTGETNPVPLLISEHPQLAVREGHDSIETALKLELPVGVSGWFQQPDGAHYFAFEAKKDTFYGFEVESDRHGLPLDSLIEVYDSTGKKLSEADDERFTKD
ncbi:MAG: hypothetical protein ACREIV_01610, partial [Planctomycetaceae bacterium]